MFNFFEKYKLQYYILTLIVFGIGAYFYLHDYFSPEVVNLKEPKMRLMTGIACGLMALIKIVDIIGLLKKKKAE